MSVLPDDQPFGPPLLLLRGYEAPPHDPIDQLSDYLLTRGYSVITSLGEGAYGVVLKAADNRTGLTVAIKVFPADSRLDMRSLEEEVRTLAKAEGSRGVIGLKEIALDAQPHPYFVMQYAPRGSLGSFVRSPHSIEQVVDIFDQIVQTMTFVHGRGIVHCDLKPENILLNEVEDPLIADFGQARLSNSTRRSLGTLFYMAPDQTVRDHKPDPRWDIYSLGAILYAMITGKAPRESSTLGEKIKTRFQENQESALEEYCKILREARPPIDHWRKVDRRLAAIVDGCLRVDPNQRFQNLDEVRDRLRRRTNWMSHRRVWVRVDSSTRTMSLSEKIAKGPIPENEASNIFRQVVDAVDRLHAQGLRHHDLQPRNIHIAGPNAVVDQQTILIDIADITASLASGKPSIDLQLGFSQSLLPFTAPELLTTFPPSKNRVGSQLESQTSNEKPIDSNYFRSDLYSLGGLLYFMLTGKAPRHDLDTTGPMADPSLESGFATYRHAVEKSPIPTDHHSTADWALTSLVDACLQPDAQQRPESTRVILNRLDRRDRWRKNRRAFKNLLWLALLALILLGGVGVGAGFYFMDSARHMRTDQTKRANRELLRITERILTEELQESMQFVEDLADHGKRANDGILQILTKHSECCSKALDPQSRMENASELQKELSNWLKRHYSTRYGRSKQIVPVAIFSIATDKQRKTIDGYLAALVRPRVSFDDSSKKIDFEHHFQPLTEKDRVVQDEYTQDWIFRDYLSRQTIENRRGFPGNLLPSRASISQVYLSKLPQNPSWNVDITIPIQSKDGETIGLVSTSVKVRNSNSLERQKEESARKNSQDTVHGLVDYWVPVNQLRQLVLINDRGWWVYHLSPNDSKPINPPYSSFLLESGAEGESERFVDPAQSRDRTFVANWKKFYPFGESSDSSWRSPSWTILVMTDKDEVDRPIDVLFRNLIWIGSSSITGVVVIAGWILFGLYRQLRYGVRLKILPWTTRRVDPIE